MIRIMKRFDMIFRSPLRRKIEMKILKLKLQLFEIRKEKELYKDYKQAQEICSCIIKERDIEKQIDLLKSLLS